MTMKLLETFAVLGALAGACTANSEIGHELPPGDGGLICRGTGQPPSCPTTWEEAQTRLDCSAKPDSVTLGHSGDLLGRFVLSGGQTSYCFYDPATHVFVGGLRQSLFPDFCNETAYAIYYGVAEPNQDFVNDIEGAPKCPGRGNCRAPLAESSCRATWQEAQADPMWCAWPPGTVRFGHAAGWLAVSAGGGYGVFACYYDAVTFALVGTYSASDTNGYCDGTSFDIIYGDAVVPGIPFKPDLGAPSCPDAGARP